MRSIAQRGIIFRATLPLTMAQYEQNIRTSGDVISQLTSVVRQAEQFQARQARARNGLLPIHTLPREMLSQIWTYVTYNSVTIGKDAVWILVQVSKIWADIIFISSEMWCDISSAFSKKRTEWALKKSAGRPLHIFLGMEYGVAEIFNMVLPLCHRWRELRLAAGLPEITISLRAVSLPMLESLQIQPRPGTGNIVEPPNLLASPGLRSLILDYIPLDWPSPSSVPGGLRSLTIRYTRNGPTFSQLFALLSSTPLLEQLALDGLGPPPGGQPASSEADQKPLVMPHLRKLRISRLEQTLTPTILSCIKAENCRTLIVVPFNLPSSQNATKGLRALLDPIASSSEELFLTIINISGSGYAILSTFEANQTAASSARMQPTGFSVGFHLGPNCENLQAVVSFLSYTPIPISLTIRCYEQSTTAAFAAIDWDQLPSLRRLIIFPLLDPSPILFSLCKPRGPRQAPRWPCPQLTVLKFPGLNYVPLGFCAFLRQRWGPPEIDGLVRDTSRPARLSLCQIPKERLSKTLSPESMAHFADDWEESAPPLQAEPTTPGLRSGG